MIENIINKAIYFLLNLEKYPLVLLLIIAYNITKKALRTLNKDKDDAVDFIDSMLGLRLKLQDTSIKTYENKGEIYQAKTGYIKEKDKYKSFKKQRRNKKLNEFKDKLKRLTRKKDKRNKRK